MRPDLSVVVPSYNEAESLPELADQVRDALDGAGLSFEVWVVDDGSDDGTWEALAEIHRADERFAGVRFRRNYGKSAALAAGFSRARGRFVATLDADLQDDPAELPEMVRRLDGADRTLARRDDSGPSIWLFVGVNGVGKTTTIGKLASRETAGGVSTLLAAGDTFRAAAAEQLTMWGERAGVEVVRGSEGGDPSSVVFDAVERAAARGIELVLADTAGRLHTKSNLMDELSKVRRVAEKGAGVVTETLLVIDATTGQNGLVQAREFREATDVTGVVVTKLDGSAKGGIVFAIETELGIPVKLIGVGEGVDDLVPFDPSEFVDALVGR